MELVGIIFCGGILYSFKGLWVRVLVFVEFACWIFLKFASAPGPFRGSEGFAPMRARSAACYTPYIRYYPFFPVQSQPTELLATTEERWRRFRSLRRHKAVLLAELFYLLF